jgi:hypothetical protein
MIATVHYQIATYSGDIDVPYEEGDEDEIIISKAKSILRRKSGGSFPFGYQSWKVISRED